MRHIRLLVGDLDVIQGGVETVQVNLLPELAVKCERLVWLLPEHRCGYFKNLIGNQYGIQIESMGWPRLSWQKWIRAIFTRIRQLSSVKVERIIRKIEEKRIQNLARENHCNLYFSTCIFRHPNPRLKIPIGGIIHDVNLNQPNGSFIRGNMVQWMNSSKYIFCDSKFTYQNACGLNPVAQKKISIVPLAASSVLWKNAEGEFKNRSCQFFYPASAIDNKDHLTLFQACMKLIREGYRFRILLTGDGTGQFWKNEPCERMGVESARQYLKKNSLALQNYIESKGYVDIQTLIDCYRQSTCVVLPSKYEGFGLPLLEAWQMGMPVICSEIPPFLEQIEFYKCKDWADTFPVGNVNLLADKMRQHILLHEFARRPLCDRSKKLDQWTWSDVADRYLSVMTKE